MQEIEEIKSYFVNVYKDTVVAGGNITEQVVLELWRTLEPKITELIQRREREASKVTGETSDGYHTFSELYEFRKLYNAGFFNQLPKECGVHKSKKHSDGELCFGGGWFIVTAYLTGKQISNHYELKDWGLFHCEERELADVWDGHTAQDVAKRLYDYLKDAGED